MQRTHFSLLTNLILLSIFSFIASPIFAQFDTNGTATNIGNDCYRMTQNIPSQQGSIFNTTPVDFNADFAVSGTMNFGNNDGNGADGYSFILTNSTTALGTGGGDIGYGGIFTSVTIEFDTWQNTDKGDPFQDHIAITSAGSSNHSGFTALAPPVSLPNLEDGQDHCFEITWSAATQTLTGSIDGASVSFTGDIPALFFNLVPDVYYGFTSSTGGSSNEHVICFSEPTLVPMQDQEICEGESVQLQADPNGSSYSWTPDPTLSALNVSNPTATPTVTTLYNVLVDFDCGSPIMDDVLVTVTPSPVAVAFSNSPLCEGELLDLSAVGGVSYSWTGPDNFTSNLQNPTLPNVSSENQGMYTVTVTDADGCEGTDFVSVIIFPAFASILPQNPICQNEGQIQMEGVPSGGTWGGVADINGVVIPSTLNTGTHTVTYNVIDTNGCENDTDIMIEILPVNSINITSPFLFCTSDPIQNLTAIPPGGIWSGATTISGEINPETLGEGFHTVSYTTTGTGCNSDTIFMIEILPATVVSIMSESPYCQDAGTQTLTASVPGGTWGGVANATGEVDPNLLTTGTHEVTYTTAGGCAGTAQIFIEILGLPTADFGTGGVLCNDDSYSLEINTAGTTPITVEYTIDGTPQPPLTLNGGANFIETTEAGIYEITQVTSGNNCTNQSLSSAIISQADSPQLVSSDATCNAAQTDYQVTFEITGGDPATYTVESLIVGSFSENPPYVFTSDFIPSDDFYYFLVYDQNQCDSIEISGNFSCQCLSTSGTDDAEICQGESLFLAGAAQSESGDYIDTLMNINGCDSFLTTTLTILNTDTLYFSSTSCNPNDVGVFPLSFTNQAGCDSTEILTITLDTIPDTEITSSTCNPDDVGVFSNIVLTSEGCDSIVIETVVLLQSDSIYLPDATTCIPANAGDFMTVETNQFGCDSTIFQTIILSDAETYNISSTTCNPDEEGVFSNTYETPEGCDSIVIETVVLLQSDSIYLPDATTCIPANAGDFMTVETNQFGCDSTIFQTIILSDAETYNISSTTCNPDEEGVFSNTYETPEGCDSIVIETVVLLQSDSIYLPDATTCIPANAGDFMTVETNQFGCDSTIFQTIILSDAETYNISSTTCNPDEEGVFSNTYETPEGCDSIVIETVVLLQSDSIYLPDATTCIPANAGDFMAVETNQFGCDSTIFQTIILSDAETYNISSTTCNPDEEGVFSNTYETPEGCDSIVIETVVLLQSDSIYLPDATTCIPANAGDFMTVETNQFGCDSTIFQTIILSDAETYNISSTTCNPDEEGVFSNTFETPEGCDSIVIETIVLLQSDSIYLPDALSCDPAEVGSFSEVFENENGCDSTVFLTVNLAPSDLVNIPLTTCDPAEVGEVIFDLFNQFGCDSTVIETTTLLPQNECGVSGTIAGSTIDCDETTGSFAITVDQGQAPFDVIWTGAENGAGVIDNLAEEVIFSDLSGGSYEVVIVDANGFEANLSVDIGQNFPPDASVLVISDYNGYDVSCNGASDGIVEANAIGGQTPYSYLWSNGTTEMTATNLAAQVYSVTVIDDLNCADEVEINLTEPEVLTMTFEVSDLDCFGQDSGLIMAEVMGGVPPYYFTLNDNPPQESNIFTSLTDGIFTVSVEDANGCEISEIIGVNAPLSVDVSITDNTNTTLGENVNISLGESVNLTALTNLDMSLIDSVFWTNLDSAECPSCVTQNVVPLFTTTYAVTVIAENGCVDADDLTIFVDRDKNVYVPTAFSPDADFNNIFMIFAGDNVVANIKEFKIVNRWGNMLFAYNDFLPNDPIFGWNGNFRGQPLNTGVYVWYAVIEFVDGETEVFKGDVLLVR